MKLQINSCVYFLLMFLFSSCVFAGVKGIYLNQGSIEKTSFLKATIKKSKNVGIDTFVVDVNSVSQQYRRNIKLLKDNNIKFVARIVVFESGGNAAKVKSEGYWSKKFVLVKKAINLGADEIQLDYIRYSTKQPPSKQNSKDILEVIKWFKHKISAYNIPMQIDVFGETSFGESKRIGQNLKLFAPIVDAVCPMVYPSHFEPYKKHAKQPYKTVYSSLTALKKQFNNNIPFKLYAFIELSNYRYKLGHNEKLQYISDQIKAVNDANADGWYAWSANNYYDNLYMVLKNMKPGKSKISVKNIYDAKIKWY